jgi:hypothetical protein
MAFRLFAVVCFGLIVVGIASTAVAQALPGTEPLTMTEPLDEVMVDGIDRFALRALADSVAKRAAHWNRDYSSQAAYLKSVAKNRSGFRTIIGAVDERPQPQGIELIASTTDAAVVAETDTYQILAVRWPALRGVYGEGLLLQPKSKPLARVIALPDADWTPEMFIGLAEGVDVPAR